MTEMNAQRELLCLLVMFCILILNSVTSLVMSSYIIVFTLSNLMHLCVHLRFAHWKCACYTKSGEFKRKCPLYSSEPTQKLATARPQHQWDLTGRQCWPLDVWMGMSRWFQTSTLFKLFLLCLVRICDSEKSREMIKWLSWSDCFETQGNCRNIN